jgi:hypothetical protein
VLVMVRILVTLVDAAKDDRRNPCKDRRGFTSQAIRQHPAIGCPSYVDMASINCELFPISEIISMMICTSSITWSDDSRIPRPYQGACSFKKRTERCLMNAQ